MTRITLPRAGEFTIASAADVEAAARADYEAARKIVSGRAPWEGLDPECGYDMGMKAMAYQLATEQLDVHPDGYNGPCFCKKCAAAADA